MCEACHSMFALCSALVPKSEAKGLASRDGNSSEAWACSDQAKKETMANMLMFIIHCSMTENPRKSTPKTQKNEKSYLFFRLNSLTIKGMPKIGPRFLCHFHKWLNLKGLWGPKQPVTARTVVGWKPTLEKPFGFYLAHGNGFDLPNGARLVENAFENIHDCLSVSG